MGAKKTIAELIADAADEVVAGWPKLTDEGREQLAQVMAATQVQQPAEKAVPRRLGRAA